MSEFLDRINQLSPEQRDLLQQHLSQRGKNASQPPELAPSELAGDRTAPLSFAQEREWFRDRLDPGDHTHNITTALRLEGSLSMPALSAALDEILRRHATLRAKFKTEAGALVQTISVPLHLPIEFVDFSDLDPVTRESRSRSRHAEEIRHGFDLANDLLLRATLIRLGQEDHLLLLAMHHIASDGWSIGILLRELSALYTALVQSEEPDLPALSIGYADFAAWQRQRMEDGAFDRGLSYWRKQLADPPPVLELRSDRGNQSSAARANSDVRGATCFLQLGRELKQQLEELSRAEHTTLFTTLLASFMVLLMRCTGQRDMLIGCPVSGRTRVEMERVIGLFLNTIVLRVKLSPELTFREALRAVRQTVLDGLEHHEVPFEKVIQELDLKRQSASDHFFDILFNFTPSPPRVLELPSLRARQEEPPEIGAEFSTNLFVTEWEEAVDLRLVYPEEQYTAARMSGFLDQMQGILQQVVIDADRSLADLDLVTPQSRALLPDPGIELEMPEQTPVPQAIAQWVARTPGHAAINQRDISITYAELGGRMAAVAERLRAAGLRSGDTVAVFGPRSPGVVVCMASALLAGGVLFTLSPDLPLERRQLLLAESNAHFLLWVGSGREEDEALREVPGLNVISVDVQGRVSDQSGSSEDSPHNDSALEQDLARFLTKDDDGKQGQAAYLFFTSGTTGKPKGVVGTHAGLAHFLDWQRTTFDVGSRDRCSQLTSLSFDVVLRDIFLPLTSGATLVLPSNDDLASSDSTLRWLEREAISLVHAVPTVAEMWLLQPPADVTLSALRRIFFAGEPLTSALVHRWRQAFPRAGEIINLYGPTETTLAKCYYRVPAKPLEGIQPLGRPQPQTQALVLTTDRKMCGIGEPGEIALRTPFRSLGYLGNPDENARRFIDNPFRSSEGDKLYLTGDRGVFDAKGQLEFLGRLDDQIKLRGVRVEPIEITNTLRTCPEVASCAVVARPDAKGDLALVAYVVLASNSNANTSSLQEFLRQRLPAALVPTVFVFMDSLPLTSNQKLDRSRLPAPDITRPELDSGYLPPRDAQEIQLLQVWEEVLSFRPIGVRDNFFELGGHSLMALRLLMRIEQRLGRKIPLAALLECATIEHLAAVMRREQDEWPPVVTLWQAEHRLKFFLVHPGGGTSLNYIHLVRHLAAEVPIHGLQARGLNGQSEPHRNLEQMAADYIDEIRRLQPDGPYLLAGHSLGGVIAFEMARQLDDAGQPVALLALFDSALSQADQNGGPAHREFNEDARDLAKMVATIGSFMQKDIRVSYEDLCGLSTDDQIEYVVAELKRRDALPFGDRTELTRSLLHVNRAHIEARRNYRASTSNVPITLFRARDVRSSQGDIDEANISADQSLGWSAVSKRPVRILWTPGDHVTMMTEPHVQSLAETLRTCLAEALGA